MGFSRSRSTVRRRIEHLSAHAAVLDGDGAIVAVNTPWVAFARENGLRDESCGVGTSYLRTCEAPAARGTEGPSVASAIRRILGGAEQPFHRTYSCHGPRRPAWFRVEVASLRHRGDRGALVTHVPVDEAVVRREIAEAERKHIARELHDSTAQNLSLAVLDLEAVAQAERSVAGVVDERLQEALALCRRSLGEVRSLSYELAPPGFQPGRLLDSLKRLAGSFTRRTGLLVMVCAAPLALDGEISRETSEALYRAAEESLYNARRHGGGRQVTLLVERGSDGLSLEVADDGRGLAPDAVPGKGLTDARERIEACGGRLEISATTPGTVVRAVVPVEGKRDGLDRHRR